MSSEPPLLSTPDGGRCDESCYNARGKVCTCPCAGICHGVGEVVARQRLERRLERLKAGAAHQPALF